MRVVPLSATQTKMEYDVFKRKTVSMEQLKDYMEFYEQVGWFTPN
jgi:archaellum component FlaD/FlaE